jgi:multiple sugar transport system permease protein
VDKVGAQTVAVSPPDSAAPTLGLRIPRRSQAERRRSRRRSALRKYGVVVLMLSPWIVGFIVFTGGPMIVSLFWSFTHYDMASAPRWIGLDNYKFMFGLGHFTHSSLAPGAHDPYYWQAVRNTLYIIVFGVPLRVVFAMLTAMLLTRPKRGVNAYRTMFFMPAMAPKVAAALVFVFLLNPTSGPATQLINAVSGGRAPLWFFDPTWAKPALLIMGLWGIGDAIVIYLAGLLNVPRELYEAISIEGATAWQRFRNVTLPLMTPVIFFTIVLGVIDGFQYFDQAFVASNVASGQTAILGTPENSLLFYSIYLYQWAFRNFNMGYAAAMAWVLFAATMAVTAVLLLTSRRWVHYGGGDQ